MSHSEIGPTSIYGVKAISGSTARGMDLLWVWEFLLLSNAEGYRSVLPNGSTRLTDVRMSRANSYMACQ